MNQDIIATKQDFGNKNFVFCVIGNEIRFGFIPNILFYDYINITQAHCLINLLAILWINWLTCVN